jgi:hypothetical protein
VGASVVALASAAAAAPPEKAAPVPMPNMDVQLVRSAHPGCEPQCPQWIAAQGKIVGDTPKLFRKVLSQLGDRKPKVFVDSPGGSVEGAKAIGRLIRAKGLDVVVSKTELLPCAPEDAACRKAAKSGGEVRGLVRSRLSRCVSACAFILAGGVRRFVGPGTGVGLTQILMTSRTYQVRTNRSTGETHKELVFESTGGANKSDYAEIRKYYAEMGLGEAMMKLVEAAPSNMVRWLSPLELWTTSLATDTTSSEELITGVAPSRPSTFGVPTQVSPVPAYINVCDKLGLCPPGQKAPGALPAAMPPTAQPAPEATRPAPEASPSPGAAKSEAEAQADTGNK